MRRRHAMPFGAELRDDGTRFALWAPDADDVVLVLDGKRHPMAPGRDGWRDAHVPGVGAGARYGFSVAGGDTVPDPASRSQPDDVSGLSAVVDPGAYSWSDAAWTGRAWEEAVIYEAHVGTATPAGTFAAFADTLPGLADLGITAVELMPLSDFAGRRNWGYDGVLPFAPDSAYGPPDDLKRLVDRAHGLGLMVLLDVVYNHFGPVGNYLSAYAASFFTERHQTPWGAGLNFDGPDGRPVRDFFVHNALYWLEEYHLDGLRFDAVHAILDDSDPHIVAEIARRARDAFPGRTIHLVLENERNGADWLRRNESLAPSLHTAQWNDDIHHCWHALLTDEREGYYEDYADRPIERLARCLAEGFAYQGEPSRHGGGAPRGEPSGHLPPAAFVAFLQNHDQIGNRALGERLPVLASAERLRLARAGLMLSPQIPMLFMGEEWDATTPFPFFVDFAGDEELSRAVREGRRREFQHFAAFSNPEHADLIPDPTAEGTFRSAILDRAEAGREPHAATFAEFRRLIRLRRDNVVPMTRTRYRGARARRPGETSLDIVWRYDGGTLRFAANLGRSPVEIALAEGSRAIWASDGLDPAPGPVMLPGWTGLFATGAVDESG